jgi:hypothetical protein
MLLAEWMSRTYATPRPFSHPTSRFVACKRVPLMQWPSALHRINIMAHIQLLQT